jgi:ParB-like chromosome segregation protein Spo0J
MVSFSQRLVPLDEIDATDRSYSFRLRDLAEGPLRVLANSIELDGLAHPLVLAPGGPPYSILCGFRRHAALTLLTEEGRWTGDVPCRIAGVRDEDALLRLSLAENRARQDLTPFELAAELDALSRRRRKTYEQIGEILGLKPKTIQRYRRAAPGERGGPSRAAGRADRVHARRAARRPEPGPPGRAPRADVPGRSQLEGARAPDPDPAATGVSPERGAEGGPRRAAARGGRGAEGAAGWIPAEPGSGPRADARGGGRGASGGDPGAHRRGRLKRLLVPLTTTEL